MIKKIISAVTLVAFIGTVAWAEPEPYEEDEFPQWALDLRRGEVIFFGSIPFSFLFTSLGYSLIRYGVNGFDPAYAPAITPGPNTVPMTQGEITGVVLVGLGVSLMVALADFIIGKIISRREAAE